MVWLQTRLFHRALLCAKATGLYAQAGTLLALDRPILSRPLTTILDLPTIGLVAWISQADPAILRCISDANANHVQTTFPATRQAALLRVETAYAHAPLMLAHDRRVLDVRLEERLQSRTTELLAWAKTMLPVINRSVRDARAQLQTGHQDNYYLIASAGAAQQLCKEIQATFNLLPKRRQYLESISDLRQSIKRGELESLREEKDNKKECVHQDESGDEFEGPTKLTPIS
jgi:hypothetical protein